MKTLRFYKNHAKQPRTFSLKVASTHLNLTEIEFNSSTINFSVESVVIFIDEWSPKPKPFSKKRHSVFAKAIAPCNSQICTQFKFMRQKIIQTPFVDSSRKAAEIGIFTHILLCKEIIHSLLFCNPEEKNSLE